MSKNGLKITTSFQNMRKNILNDIGNTLNTKIQRAIPTIRAKLQTEIKALLWASPLVTELQTGNSKLQGTLGVDDVDNRLTSIIDAVADSLIITLHNFRSGSQRNMVGYISIRCQKMDYRNLYQLDASHITEQTITNLNWLEWLLEYGSLPIVSNYMVLGSPPINNIGQYSRTGLAIMVPNQDRDVYIQAQFQGTSSDNWITRSLLPHIYASIEKIIIPQLT